jgi:small-conductance mechanosensitive channel
LKLETYVTWLKAHEKLLIVGVTAFVIFHLGSKGLDAWVSHDKQNSSTTAQVVVQDDAATKTLVSQVNALQATVSAQNSALKAVVTASQAAVKKQQATDATLSPNDLAARVSKLLDVPPAEVTAVPTGDIDLQPPAAVIDVQQLELVPALQGQVAAQSTIITNDNTVIAKQGDLINQLTKDVSDAKAQDAADVKTLTAEKKKSWMNGFKWGAIAGVTLGIIVRH